MLRFGLLLAALVFLVSSDANAQGVSNNRASNRSPNQSDRQPANISQPNYLAAIDWRLRQIGRLLDSKIADEQSTKNEDRAERNVKAQERVSNYAPLMLGLGLVEIIVTAFGVWFVRRTILESRAATEDDIRPYVQISRCKFEFSRGNKPRFVVRVQNSGQTPATFFEVSFSTKAVELTDNGVDWKMPDQLERKQVWNALGGNDSVTVGLYDPKISEEMVNVQIDKAVLFAIGKVRYGDIWGNEYETEFAYWLRDTSPTLVGNSTNGWNVKPRKMSRATGEMRTYDQTKKA